jgi:hypothetical protein
MSAHVFGTPAGSFHDTWTAPGYHIKAGFRHTRPHFARLLVVFIVFLEAGGSKNGNTWTFKVQTTEAFDELKKDAEGEGEFGESASGSLVNFKIVIAVVSVFFCHVGVSNIAI